MVYNSGRFIMKKYFAVFSVLILFAFTGCYKNAGDPITKEFSVSGNYTELQVEDAFEVTVSDAVSQVTITAGENIMPKVVVEVDGNKLKIRLKPVAVVVNDTELKAVIPYNINLTNVDLSGASEFHSSFGLQGQKVEVELSGASDFYCNIAADKVEIDASGASNFYGNVNAASELFLDMSGSSNAAITGQAPTFKMDLSGSSTFQRKVDGTRYAFSCSKCRGEMSGSSDAYLHCDNSIKVDLSGSSDLHYTGNASTSGCSCSGGSNVVHDVL